MSAMHHLQCNLLQLAAGLQVLCIAALLITPAEGLHSVIADMQV